MGETIRSVPCPDIPTILLASSNGTEIREFGRLMESDGLHVVWAEDFVDLMHSLGTHSVDMIVCSTELPDVRGPGIIRHLRRQCSTAKLIVVAHGYSPEEELRLRQEGVSYVAYSPVDLSRLREVVLKCLGHGVFGKALPLPQQLPIEGKL